MLEMAEAGNWDIVAGIRTNRQGRYVLRKIPSRIANAIIERRQGLDERLWLYTQEYFGVRPPRGWDYMGNSTASYLYWQLRWCQYHTDGCPPPLP